MFVYECCIKDNFILNGSIQSKKNGIKHILLPQRHLCANDILHERWSIKINFLSTMTLPFLSKKSFQKLKLKALYVVKYKDQA